MTELKKFDLGIDLRFYLILGILLYVDDIALLVESFVTFAQLEESYLLDFKNNGSIIFC